MENSIRKTIEGRISAMKNRSVIAVVDFCDVAESKTASKTLVRMCKEGIAEKLKKAFSHLKKTEIAKILSEAQNCPAWICSENTLFLRFIRTRRRFSERTTAILTPVSRYITTLTVCGPLGFSDLERETLIRENKK